MVNPFDDETSEFHVLINDEGQHSLWPVFAPVPGGWRELLGPDTRQACVQFIENHWTDMRPNSLIASMRDRAAT